MIKDVIKEEICAMVPGYELDNLIADVVMDWPSVRDNKNNIKYYLDHGKIITIEHTSFGSFNPSTDIRAAWEIVEKIEDMGYEINIHGHKDNYVVEINKPISESLHMATLMINSGLYKTAQEAICKASLLLKELLRWET